MAAEEPMKGQGLHPPMENEPQRRLPSLRRIIGGGVGFVVFSVTGIYLATRLYPSSETTLLTSFPVSQLALLGLLALADFFLGGLRYQIFFNGRELPRVSLWRCMCANWANMFMGVVTPFQTGGGPAQIYILWREGVKVSQALLISLLTFAATLVFFLAASAVAMVTLSTGGFDPTLLKAIQAAFVVIASIVTVVLGLLIFPAKGILIADWIGRRLSKIFPSAESRIMRVIYKVESELDVFRRSLLGILRNNPFSLPIMTALTAMLFFNKYLMAYVIARGLEPGVPFDTFMGLQVLQHLITYYAPTPGASGLAGISATWLLDEMLRPEQMATYIVAWRFFTTLLGALLGIPVLVGAFRSPGLRTEAPAVRGDQ